MGDIGTVCSQQIENERLALAAMARSNELSRVEVIKKGMSASALGERFVRRWFNRFGKGQSNDFFHVLTEIRPDIGEADWKALDLLRELGNEDRHALLDVPGARDRTIHEIVTILAAARAAIDDIRSKITPRDPSLVAFDDEADLYFVFAKDDFAYGDTAFVVERYQLEFSRMPELVLHKSICAMCYPDAKEKLAKIGLGWSDLPHPDATGHVERLEQSNLLGCGLYDGDPDKIESILGEYASDYRSCPRHPDKQAE